jgi:hypothetical protein
LEQTVSYSEAGGVCFATQEANKVSPCYLKFFYVFGHLEVASFFLFFEIRLPFDVWDILVAEQLSPK